MRVLITGLAGMLGSNLAYLLRDKYQVFGVDTNEFQMERVTHFRTSALDTQNMEEIIEQNNIDVIIHCAALVNVDACEKEENYAQAINTIMTKNLNYFCRKRGVKFVFISSDAVYSGTKNGLNSEIDTPNPISVYGRTKFEAEKEILKNANALIIRTNMYGFNYRNKNSFGEWIVEELREENALNMFYDVFFSPILVNRLVDVLDLCIQKDLIGIYNVGSRCPISKYELGVLIKEKFGLGGDIHYTSMHDFHFIAPRTENMGLDVSKIQDALGIQLSTPEQDVAEFKRLFESGYATALKKGV